MHRIQDQLRQQLSAISGRNASFTLTDYAAAVNTLAQIARSYGLKPEDLSRFVGTAGVDPLSELNDGQIALIVELIDKSGAFTSGGAGRHHF